MKTGVSLQALAAKIEGARDLKHDLIASTRDLEMTVHDDGKVAMQVGNHAWGVAPAMASEGFPVLPTAHSQIGGRLGIPAKYYDRMRQHEPKLLADNVNTWLHKSGEKRMLRTLGGDLRAFLSNRYQRIEHEEIAEVALPILAGIPDVQIVSCELTERRMYIQAVSPRVMGEVKKGDVVQAGVIISNSEIGMGSVSISPMIYRLVCLNGLVLADGRMRAYHVGRAVTDSEALWADDTRQADDRAVLLKVRDTVRAAVDAAAFGARVEKLSGLTEQRVTGDPAKSIEVLARKVGATEAERGGLLRSLIEGGDLSAWGMVNAVTHQAHVAETYDRAVEFEAIGGALVDLAPREWREILQAA